MSSSNFWIVCQIGGREYYIIPSIFQAQKKLQRLYTDVWCSPKNIFIPILRVFIPQLSERNNPDISIDNISAFTLSFIFFELRQKLILSKGWDHIFKRNNWFQKKVIKSKQFELDCSRNSKPVIFCYSYAALNIFKHANQNNCLTILGQIDAGTIEEDIVADAVKDCSYLQPVWSRAPRQYWNEWKEECQLADRIIVNSHWSRKALVKAGINEKKIAVVPLMYERKEIHNQVRNYPDRFTRKRPFKVLFLGSLIVRKGIAEMLSAAQNMKNDPVEFWFVGDKGVSLTNEMKANKNIHWIGPVPRSEINKYYQMSDIFILPTLSDGFGITQLEAMSYGLPVIASRNCGEVVQDRTNGILLPEVTSDAINHAISVCLDNPEKLKQWSGKALQRARDFSPDKVFPLLMDVIKTG